MGMLNEILKEASNAELKRQAENRKEWRTWKPRTCLTQNTNDDEFKKETSKDYLFAWMV